MTVLLLSGYFILLEYIFIKIFSTDIFIKVNLVKICKTRWYEPWSISSIVFQACEMGECYG